MSTARCLARDDGFYERAFETREHLGPGALLLGDLSFALSSSTAYSVLKEENTRALLHAKPLKSGGGAWGRLVTGVASILGC